MIVIGVPGREPLKVNHVVLDHNGTAAVDDMPLKGVKERIARFKELAHVCVLTAGTYGTMTCQCEPLDITARTFPRKGIAECKEEIVKRLEGGMACLGNGLNNIRMFDTTQLSVAVLEREDICVALLSHALVVVRSIEDGPDLLLKPGHLRAALKG